MKLRDLTFSLSLDLGVLRLFTAVWRVAFDLDAKDYVCLFLEIWGKQIFMLRIYETGLSMRSRQSRKDDDQMVAVIIPYDQPPAGTLRH